MADVKKIATRESYGNALKEYAEEYPNLVVLDADLAAATKTAIFKKAYPDRHIDCGIAECDMNCGRTCNDRKDSFCKLLCYVCSRTCF